MKKKLLYFHYNPAEMNCFSIITMLLGMGLMITAWNPYIFITSFGVMLMGIVFLLYGTSHIWYMEHKKEKERVYKRMKDANKLNIEYR